MSEKENCESAEDRTPGIFSWQELVTKDTEGSIKFYTELLGWKTDSMDMGGGNTYTMLMNGERPVGGLVQPPPNAGEVPTAWVNYITVENVDETVAKAQELGAHLCMPPMDIPGKGRFATVVDPQGAVISFWQFAN